MPKYKDLVFKINSIDLSDEIASKIFITKVYHKYQQRNEWVNYNGDTKVIKRSFHLFDLNLQALRDSAELQRTPGTTFIIDEVPSLCIVGHKYALISTVLFADTPFNHYEFSQVRTPLSLRAIESILNSQGWNWYTSAIYKGKLENLFAANDNEIYYSHESISTGSKSNLAWRPSPRNVNCDKLLQFIENLERSKTR